MNRQYGDTASGIGVSITIPIKLKILSWNAHGKNDVGKRQSIKKSTKGLEGNIVCFQETKIRSLTR